MRLNTSEIAESPPRRYCGFFVPDLNFGGAENIIPVREIISRVYFHVFSPRSLNGFKVTSKQGEINMTILSDKFSLLKNVIDFYRLLNDNKSLNVKRGFRTRQICDFFYTCHIGRREQEIYRIPAGFVLRLSESATSQICVAFSKR